MILCDYGCGREAKHQFKNGKWCCSKNTSSCPLMKQTNSYKNKGRIVSQETRQKLNKINKGKKFSEEHKRNLSKAHKGKELTTEHKMKISLANKGKIFSEEHRQKLREKRLGVPGYYKNKKLSKEHKEKISLANKGREVSNKTKKILRELARYSIIDYEIKYPFFTRIEEMRYNPDKPGEQEIQVRCKNHDCPNSKEKDGWFTPTSSQLYERKRTLETEDGNDGCYFYCSQECKNICPLYNLRNDPLSDNNDIPYTQEEYQQFREFVLKRDNYECQYCEEKATIIHHERPQKLEPFFALDPDFAWSVCEKCHYKYGHNTGSECSTGNLAAKVCI